MGQGQCVLNWPSSRIPHQAVTHDYQMQPTCNAFNRKSAVQCWVARRCCPLCGFFIGKQNWLTLHHGSSNNKHFYLIQLVTHYVQLHAESLGQITSDLKLSNLVLNSHETQKGLFFFLRHRFSETSSTKALLRRCQNTIKKQRQL